MRLTSNGVTIHFCNQSDISALSRAGEFPWYPESGINIDGEVHLIYGYGLADDIVQFIGVRSVDFAIPQSAFDAGQRGMWCYDERFGFDRVFGGLLTQEKLIELFERKCNKIYEEMTSE